MGIEGEKIMKFLIGDVVAIRNDCLYSGKLITGTVLSYQNDMYYVVSDSGHSRFLSANDLVPLTFAHKLLTNSTDLSTNSEKLNGLH